MLREPKLKKGFSVPQRGPGLYSRLSQLLSDQAMGCRSDQALPYRVCRDVDRIGCWKASASQVWLFPLAFYDPLQLSGAVLTRARTRVEALPKSNGADDVAEDDNGRLACSRWWASCFRATGPIEPRARLSARGK